MSSTLQYNGLYTDEYHIDSFPKYFDLYQKSIEDPEGFWGHIAEDNFYWHKKWDKVLDWNREECKVEWFQNAKLNITENCIDRHLTEGANRTAIIWEPNDPMEESIKITYKELSIRVNKFANVLKKHGIKKGDTVCIYLPMVPELAVAVLACARIGAIHSVVFAGFSSEALSTRINDADCKLVITSDGSFRGDEVINLKNIVDHAIRETPTVEQVLVVIRTWSDINMKKGRDFYLQPELDEASEECPAEIMDAEDTLFILYTSGSTGKPKGMVHTTAGYMVYSGFTFKNVFHYKNGDVYWCTADFGWITGHSYNLYGPLVNGATTVMYEGLPSYQNYARLWKIVEKHGVNQFYTAPTAIRTLEKHSVEFVRQHDLTSLKVLGTVGEPINEEAWNWFNINVGQRKCPIVDTYWQTETGGILISPLPFVTPTKPTFATLPLPGIEPCLMDENGNEIIGNPAYGSLCIKNAWPGMARTIHNDHRRYINTYFTSFPGMYHTGDEATRDAVGYYRITGRKDDVFVINGKQLGTAPIENAIDEHLAIKGDGTNRTQKKNAYH